MARGRITHTPVPLNCGQLRPQKEQMVPNAQPAPQPKKTSSTISLDALVTRTKGGCSRGQHKRTTLAKDAIGGPEYGDLASKLHRRDPSFQTEK
jgi:hypothetical protein